MEIIRHQRFARNMNGTDRALSLGGGAWLAINGLRRGGPLGLMAALAGAEFVRRGITGSCPLYSLLGISTAPKGQGAETTSLPYPLGIRVDESIVVDRPAGEIYRFWRDLSNLPQILSHLDRVEVTGARSYWVARAPGGRTISWTAEIINDVENSLIAWRSLPGSQVDSAGSVHFTPTGDSSTEVRVELQYNPPAGIAGALFAKLFGDEPSQQIRAGLRQLKQLLEKEEVHY